jgi:OOP family OmpA-OmpF porin
VVRSALTTIVVVGALAALPARAEHDPFIRSFDAVPLKPSPSVNSGIALDGADAWDRGSLRGALLLDFNLNVLSLREGTRKLGDLIPARLDVHAMLGLQLHPMFDLSIDLPLVLYQGDDFGLLAEQGLPQPGVYSLLKPCDSMFTRGCGFADIRLLPRVHILAPESAPIGLAVLAEVRIPTGDGQSFTGDRGWTIAPRVAAEKGFGPLRVLANVGYRFRNHGQFLNLFVGHEFAAGAGVIYKLGDLASLKDVEALGELHLATQTTAPFTFTQSDSLKTPIELLVGARARLSGRWGVELSVGRGVSLESGYGRPDFRVIAGVNYIIQSADRDGDGILDDVDKCPDDPEDRDGFEDSDGCPDPDNDRDGVPDLQDACPNVPGLREFDGCPDRDKDDVPDNVDKCPDVAGPAENEGCPILQPPLVTVERDRIRLKANVLFETGEARIQKQSYPVLDEVAKVLVDHPEVRPVLIEGHTDNVGSRRYNLDLSARRARAVVDYLVKKGIDAKRLRAQGFGFDQPIAPNATPLGRAKNRRVDFRILSDIETERPAPSK